MAVDPGRRASRNQHRRSRDLNQKYLFEVNKALDNYDAAEQYGRLLQMKGWEYGYHRARGSSSSGRREWPAWARNTRGRASVSPSAWPANALRNLC
jgi:hypothetical protein